MAKKTKKQEDALKGASVRRLHIQDFLAAEESTAPVDIYIRLPKNKRLILWVEQGESFSKSNLDKIQGHMDPYIYILETSLFWGERPGRVKFEEIPHIDQEQFNHPSSFDETNFSAENLGPEEIDFSKKAAEAASTNLGNDLRKTAESVATSPSTAELAKNTASAKTAESDFAKSSVGPPVETAFEKKTTTYGNEETANTKTAVAPIAASTESSKKTLVASAPVPDAAKQALKVPTASLDSLLDNAAKQSVHTKDPVTTQLDPKMIESRLWGLFQPTLLKEVSTDVARLSTIGEQLIPLVSDDARRFKKMIMQNPRYEKGMADSDAIYAISTLFCLANGYTLRGILEELAYAVIFMDLSMIDLGEEVATRYYKDFKGMQATEKKLVSDHPSVAHRAAREKLKKVSQNCLRMIEGHHEYANGDGFPRAIRSENLPPLVRILAYAVLVFEAMKKAELEGKTLEFHAAVDAAAEPEKNNQSRRAHATTVQMVKEFLVTKAAGQTGQAA